jgi:hypothetical protein
MARGKAMVEVLRDSRVKNHSGQAGAALRCEKKTRTYGLDKS